VGYTIRPQPSRSSAHWYLPRIAGVLVLVIPFGCAETPPKEGQPDLDRTLEGITAPVFSLAFAPDGSLLATASALWDRREGIPIACRPGDVNLWECATGRLKQTLCQTELGPGRKVGAFDTSSPATKASATESKPEWITFSFSSSQFRAVGVQLI
jgi:WD40 repeat protein